MERKYMLIELFTNAQPGIYNINELYDEWGKSLIKDFYKRIEGYKNQLVLVVLSYQGFVVMQYGHVLYHYNHSIYYILLGRSEEVSNKALLDIVNDYDEQTSEYKELTEKQLQDINFDLRYYFLNSERNFIGDNTWNI